MKELLKVVAKRLFIWSIIINTIYSIADYGESFALSHFCTSPLTLEKIINLTIVIIIIDVKKYKGGQVMFDGKYGKALTVVLAILILIVIMLV